MSGEIPIGRREDLHLEFAPAESLDRPESVAREVVAMLNAEGGELWIGIGERDGVAVELQGVGDAERRAEDLLDSLADRLEPSPTAREVEVRPVSAGEGITVLRVRVRPEGGRRPYALIGSGGWHFPVRIGGRIRPMSRWEIVGARGADSTAGRLDEALHAVVEDRRRFQERRPRALRLRLQPAAELRIDVQNPLFDELVREPSRSGNRGIGWHFAKATAPPRRSEGAVSWSYEDTLSASFTAGGGMAFTISLGSLFWRGEEGEIWPPILLEYPVSAFRIARVVYLEAVAGEGLEDGDPVVADLGLFGLHGWKLRPGPTRGRSSTGFDDRRPVEYPGPEEDLTWPKPLVFSWSEVRDEPDRCGFRLVRRVYEAFGLREDAIPSSFDRRSGRLILPE